jgi:hypothetical protein
VLQGPARFKVGREELLGEQDVHPKSAKIWVKLAVRWTFVAAAASLIAWALLSHAAQQRAQHREEAAHAR